MVARFRAGLTFANVVSLVALFVALGGSAYAVTQLDRNSVRSKHIVNQQVKRADLAKNAVKSSRVKNESLRSVDLKDGKGVEDADVRADSLTGASIDESTLSQGGILTARLQIPFLTDGATTFAPVSGIGTADGNENNVTLITPNLDLVASDFSMVVGSPGTGGPGRTFTLRVNGSDTAITCHLPIGGGTCQPPETVSVPANSTLSLKITVDSGGGNANAAPAWFSFRLTPG